MVFAVTTATPIPCRSAWIDAPGRRTALERCLLDSLHALRDKSTYAPPRAQLIQHAAAVLPAPPGAYDRAADALIERGTIAAAATRGLARLLLAGDARDERRIVDAVRRFRRAPSPAPVAPVHRPNDTDRQRAAVRQALRENASIIMGPPGSGKTTIVQAIVASAQAAGLRVALSCSTGIAALRLSKVTETPAVTVHRLLRADPESDETLFRRTADNPLAADIVIVDECSMLDLVSLAGLLDAIQLPTRVVLIGDPYQLPPPGAGTPFLDLAETKALPTTILTHSFRNRGLIDVARRRIQNGFRPLLDNAVLTQIRPRTADHAAMIAVDLLARHWRDRDADGRHPAVRLMTPMHAGSAGTRALNALAKKKMNRFGDRRRLDIGDPVLQTKNDYAISVFNGQTGTVVSHNVQNDDILVRFNDVDEIVAIEARNHKHLELAYATTYHKSQGLQTPTAIVVLPDEAESMIAQDLFVTALTRTQVRAYVIATDRALDLAISRRSTQSNPGTLKAALVQP